MHGDQQNKICVGNNKADTTIERYRLKISSEKM